MPTALVRERFPLGWTPSADDVNGDPQGLLRMDNLRLDSLGALTLQRGLSKINASQFPGYVHSIYSRQISNVKHRFVGLSTGSVLHSTSDFSSQVDQIIDTTGNIARARFSGTLGSIFVSSGQQKKKYDGSTTWNWGLETPKSAVGVTPNSKSIYVVGNLDGGGNANNWTIVEGANQAYQADSIQFDSDGTTLRSTIGTIYSSPRDYTAFPGGGNSTDSDILNFSTRLGDSGNLTRIRIEFLLGPITDLTASSQDYFWYEWQHDIDKVAFQEGVNVWEALNAARSAFSRTGSDSTLDWSTVGGIRVTYIFSAATTNNLFEASTLWWTGSDKDPINGSIDYVQVNVRDNGVYVAKSGIGVLGQTYTIINGNVTLTPTVPSDPQVNQIWIYRRGGTVPNFSRTIAINLTAGTYEDASGNTGSYASGGTVLDKSSDEDILTLNLTANLFTQSVADIKDEFFSVTDGLYLDRMVMVTLNQVLISESKNPDAVDQSVTIKLSGDNTERIYWVSKLSSTLLMVGTSKNLYEVTGTFTQFPDGSVDALLRPLGENHPPIALEFSLDSSVITYMAADGWRRTAGGPSELISPQLRHLFQNESRYGVNPLIIANYNVNYAVAVYKGQVVTSNPLQDGTRPLFVYDIILNYWRYWGIDPISLFVEEDGTLLGGFGDPDHFNLCILDTGNTLDDGTTGQNILFQTIFDSNSQPKNRKDAYTLRILMDTGGVPVDIYITPNNGTQLKLGSFSANGLTVDTVIDLFQPLTLVQGLAFRYQLQIVGTGLKTFTLKRFSLDYDARPEILTSLRILPSNLGTYSRKRFTNYAFVIDTLGNPVKFTPDIDGTLVTSYTDTLNFTERQTYILYFTDERIGTDIGGILESQSGEGFEFYGLNLEEIISEKLPVPVKYLVIPANNYGTPNRKRHSSYKFQINTRGKNVQFVPILDGVSYAPATYNTSTKQTVEYFFSVDTISIDIGGTLASLQNTPFEFYGAIQPQEIEVLPPRLKEYRIPESNYGIASKKRIRTMPMEINTNGFDVTFTPIVDGVNGTPTTINTSTRKTAFHYFTTDVFGVDFSGELTGGNPFEFYGLLKPEEVEILPVPKVFDQVGPVHLSRIGKIIGFRLRIITGEVNLPWVMYGEDNQIASGTLVTIPNIDTVYEQEWITKSRNATISRIEFGPSPGKIPFHRFYLELKVNYGGESSDIKIIRLSDESYQRTPKFA